MQENMVPRLCGGTFFTLLMNAKKTKGVNQEDSLNELLCIFDKDAKTWRGSSSITTITSSFRNCADGKSDYINLGNATMQMNVTDHMMREYNDAIEEMRKFADGKLNLQGKAMWLVRALLELVMQDEAINQEENLYINPGNVPIQKKDIKTMKTINVYSFLLGIWYYCFLNCDDNSVGKDTLIEWTESQKESTVRKLKTSLGNTVSDIVLSYEVVKIPDDSVEDIEEDDIKEEQHSTEQGQSEYYEEKTVNQILNTPAIINQKAEKIINIGHVDHLEI